MRNDVSITELVSILKKNGISSCINMIHSDRDNKYRSYIQIPYGPLDYLISQLSSVYYVSYIGEKAVIVETSPGTLYDARFYPHSLDTLIKSVEDDYQKDKGIIRGW